MKILAIGAHLDDAEIACAGTIARAVANGHHVKMLVLSDSSYESRDGTVLRTVDEAIREGVAAARVVGVEDIEVLDFPTLDIPYASAVVGAIERQMNAFLPDIILTHWPFDTHQDHRNTGLASISAGRYFTSILMYEPMMPSGRSYVAFRPQLYVDVSDYISLKLDALRAHESQHRKYGDAWIEAVESRCRLRGFEMGVRYAEAFEAVRFEWKP
ncbi:MAG: PIG-L family deacetylase [Actinobacteria bacterium]|nr:PIG-L family deacetylase [Actinomycetota bacterium]